jgi:prolyl 4-hydroxylase
MTIRDIAARFDALLAGGRAPEALALIERASVEGDLEARFLLAVHLLSGEITARDLPRARGLLRQGAAQRHEGATMLEIALTANGSGAARDWRTARRLLEEAAAHYPDAKRQLDLLTAMRLDDDGGPSDIPDARQISDHPEVFYFPALLSPDECEWIATTANALLTPSIVVDPRTGRMVAHPIRTSDGAVIGPGRENLVMRAINRRIAAISKSDIDQGEPLAVLRYSPGQQYRPHHDCITGAANQRIKTAIIYLNQGYQGGATRFTANGLTISGKAGDAIVFLNTLPDGGADRHAEHAGLPVERGQKWIATRWIRAGRHDPWNDR